MKSIGSGNNAKLFITVILLVLIAFLIGFYIGFSEFYELTAFRIGAEKGIHLSPANNPLSWRISYYGLIAGVLSSSLLAKYFKVRVVNLVTTILLFASLFPAWTLFFSIPSALTGSERISPSDFGLILYLEIFAFPLLVLLAFLHLVHLFRISGEDGNSPAIL